MGLGPGKLPYQEKKSPHSLRQAYHLVWEYLALFHAEWMFLCSALACVPMAFRHGPSFQYVSVGETWERSVSFCCSMRGVHIGQFPCVSCQGHLLAIRDGHTLLELILLCLLPMWVKALSHPGLDCVVFSLATLISRHSGKPCLDFYSRELALGWSLLSSMQLESCSGTDYWYTVFCPPYSLVWMYHNLLILSPTDGHLECF